MASKRDIKRDLNYMIVDVVEECFSVQLYNSKKTEESDKLIDEVIDFGNGMASKIHAAKTKKDFAPIRQAIEDAAVDFIHKVNAIQ